MRATRVLMLLSLVVLVPREAAADWLITPFIGVKFAGRTTLVDPDNGAGDTKLTFGGSFALLTSGILGVEADFGYSPRFFDRGNRGGLVARSNVTTLGGNVIVAVPVTVTRESLRPYVVGGLGLMHASIDDVLGVLPVHRNLFGFTVGGGAIGGITERTSIRFEIRHFKNLDKENAAVAFGTTNLSFWRVTTGVTVKIGR